MSESVQHAGPSLHAEGLKRREFKHTAEKNEGKLFTELARY